jgi:hypothetical protein
LQAEVLKLKRHCLMVEKDYDDLRLRIVKFLLPEQIEAAKVCGCTPEIYALEWFEICKNTMREHTPSFANFAEPLSAFKHSSYKGI